MLVLKTYLAIIIMILAIVVGCSNDNSPLAPVYNPEKSDQLPIIGQSNPDGKTNAIGVMGFYELNLDQQSMSVELVTKRTNEVGESYIVSGASFFTINPCSDCLSIQSISLTADGDIQLGMRLLHPFEPGDITKPPSAVNRMDLDVFDVALVIAPLEHVALDFTQTGTTIYDNVLVNNAGYTRELANVLDDNAAMPYALVVDESQSQPDPSTWNKFGMGESQDFDVTFKIAQDTALTFNLCLTMGYGFSAIKSERLFPRYLNPEFNRKAAWKVNVIPPEGQDSPEFGNTWDSADSLTTHDVTVEVYDWQIDANVDQNLTNVTDIYASSNVSTVSVEIPGMNNSLQSVNVDDGTGTGLPDSPLVFIVPIANENLLGSGTYTSLVKVSDERSVGIIGDRDYMIDVPDGINIQNYDLPEFASYQTFTATVMSECGDISGDINSPNCPVTGVSSGAYIQFSALATSGNGGGDIVLYEWDHDYDGLTFNSEFTGASASIGPFDNPDCPSPNPAPENYTVAVRATDSCVPPNVTIFATCLVTVDTCCGPISGSITDPVCPVTGVTDGVSIEFSASATSGNGGEPIVQYEWDQDYDGMSFDVDATGTTATLGPFLNPNCPMVSPPPVSYTVAVRATDSCTPPNVTIFDTCVVTVDKCCSDQELFYDFLGCGTQSSPTTYCMGWEGGGCGLQNSSSTGHGAFKWGCENVQAVCSMTHPYLLVAGSDSFHGGGFGCNVLWYVGHYADYNVVSPSINLPQSTNSYFEFDRCTGFPAGSTAYLYISENDCVGPWEEIWSLTVSDGCENDTTIDLSDYEGSNVMFRFRYTWPNEWSFWNSACGAPMESGNEGITIDDVRIAGCFNGTLEEN